jgi:hypothetical protein
MTDISLPVDEYLKIIGKLTMELRASQMINESLKQENARLRLQQAQSDSSPPMKDLLDKSKAYEDA